MGHIRSVLAAALATLHVSAAADVYKCPDGAGKLVFSDRPCDRDSKPIDLYPAMGNDPATIARKRVAALQQAQKVQEAAAAKAREQAAREVNERLIQKNEERNRVCGTEGLREVRIGLTEAEVRLCTPAMDPARINSDETAYGTSTQWVMPDWSSYRYIYFRNGRVTTISR